MCKVRMREERATKNTIKFEEIIEAGLKNPVVGTLYVPKGTLKVMGFEPGTGQVLTIDLGIEAANKESEENQDQPKKAARKTTRKTKATA